MVTETLLTIEKYVRLPNSDRPTELVRGQVVEKNFPYPYHGWVTGNIHHSIVRWLDDHDLGWCGINSGVITHRRPDTVRAADLLYYTTERLPRSMIPMEGYVEVPPNLIIDVLWEEDTPRNTAERVAEFLTAGVTVVGVVDPADRTMTVHRAGGRAELLTEDDHFTVPELFPGFACRVGDFFE